MSFGKAGVGVALGIGTGEVPIIPQYEEVHYTNFYNLDISSLHFIHLACTFNQSDTAFNRNSISSYSSWESKP